VVPVVLDVQVRRRLAEATVLLAGEIDMVSAGEVSAVLSRLLDQGCRTVEVDLSGVRFLAAAGLGVLVERDRDYRAASARLVLVRPTPACARPFALTGLDRVLTIR
jgi:anti-anti-sigma factor